MNVKRARSDPGAAGAQSLTPRLPRRNRQGRRRRQHLRRQAEARQPDHHPVGDPRRRVGAVLARTRCHQRRSSRLALCSNPRPSSDSPRTVLAWAARRMLGSLLIPLDLSANSERVLQRAMHLPLAVGARLTLLHVVPRLLRGHRARAAKDAHEVLDAVIAGVAPTLSKSVVLRRIVKVGDPVAEITSQAKSSRADLVVMGRGGGRLLRDIFLGSTAERVVRRGETAVLLVRTPARAAYHRPLLALDDDDASNHAAAFLPRVLGEPRPDVTWLHVYDAPWHGPMYPSLDRAELDVYRFKARRTARQQIEARLATVAGDTSSWRARLRQGSPRTVIPAAVASLGTDLLILGTRAYRGVAHAFLGTVAGDVLREVACDVLVVPPGGPPRGP